MVVYHRLYVHFTLPPPARCGHAFARPPPHPLRPPLYGWRLPPPSPTYLLHYLPPPRFYTCVLLVTFSYNCLAALHAYARLVTRVRLPLLRATLRFYAALPPRRDMAARPLLQPTRVWVGYRFWPFSVHHTDHERAAVPLVSLAFPPFARPLPTVLPGC